MQIGCIAQVPADHFGCKTTTKFVPFYAFYTFVLLRSFFFFFFLKKNLPKCCDCPHKFTYYIRNIICAFYNMNTSMVV